MQQHAAAAAAATASGSEARFCQPISCGGERGGSRCGALLAKCSPRGACQCRGGSPRIDVFGTARTARFLYNVTASSRLGFLHRHRPSAYYVAARQRAQCSSRSTMRGVDTYFYANVAYSRSVFVSPPLALLSSLLSRFFHPIPSLLLLPFRLDLVPSFPLPLFPFHCLSISVFLAMESLWSLQLLVFVDV